MEADSIREEFEAQIADLVEVRDESDDADEQAAANEAIELLQQKVDRLDMEVDIGAMVDEVIEKLDEILNQNSLDAVSALGRTARRLRDVRRGQTGAA